MFEENRHKIVKQTESDVNAFFDLFLHFHLNVLANLYCNKTRFSIYLFEKRKHSKWEPMSSSTRSHWLDFECYTIKNVFKECTMRTACYSLAVVTQYYNHPYAHTHTYASENTLKNWSQIEQHTHVRCDVFECSDPSIHPFIQSTIQTRTRVYYIVLYTVLYWTVSCCVVPCRAILYCVCVCLCVCCALLCCAYTSKPKIIHNSQQICVSVIQCSLHLHQMSYGLLFCL